MERELQQVLHADSRYADFAKLYLNDDIKPFLRRNIRDPEALSKTISSDKGSYRAVQDILGQKNRVLEGIRGDIVEKELARYYQNPSEVGSPTYLRTMADLAELIPEAEVLKADAYLRKHKAAQERQTTLRNRIAESGKAVTGKAAPVPVVKTKWTRSEIDKAFKSVDQLRKLRAEFKKAGIEDSFKKEAESQILDLFRGSKLEERQLTSKEIIDTILKNEEVLVELLGEETVVKMLKEAKVAQAQKLEGEKIKAVGTRILKLALSGLAAKVGLSTAAKILKSVISP
jgi:hypothetical protein